MARRLPFVLAFAAAIGLSDSDALHAQIALGAKVGIGISNFLGDQDSDFQPKANFTGGFTFTYELNRNLAFTPEVLYAVKGSKATTEIDAVLSDVSVSVTYLEVPVMLRYSLSPRSDVSPVMAIGGVASWNIDARLKYQAVSGGPEFTETDDSIKALDFGVAAEVGVDFKNYSAGIRYTYGVSNLVDNPDDPKHNGVLAITAGIGL